MSGDIAPLIKENISLMIPFFCCPVYQFVDAEILHTDGGITVICHEDCLFADGSTTKTWTCADIDVTTAAQGCVCPGEWSQGKTSKQKPN